MNEFWKTIIYPPPRWEINKDVGEGGSLTTEAQGFTFDQHVNELLIYSKVRSTRYLISAMWYLFTSGIVYNTSFFPMS